MNRETNLKVALVHDHLAQDGGAERVLRAFQEIFPGSTTYVLVYSRKNSNPFFRNQDIRTSFIQRMPLGLRRYQWYLPLMPTAVERFDLRPYDVVLSSSSALAKGVITDPTTLHLCYCHTPTRYLWTDTHNYIEELRVPRMMKKIIPFVLTWMRIWDHTAADRVDAYIANSEVVKKRINKYYKRDAQVVFPPVSIQRFSIAEAPKDYFLTGGRLVPYKRFDLVIQACNQLKLPLKIFGIGPAESTLKELAGPTVEFLGRVSDEERKNLYRHAQAFINPQEEDFGITAIESMASGRPVIAYAKGGALETVKAGQTGIFFNHQTVDSLVHAIETYRQTTFNPVEIRAYAEQFDEERFKQKIFDTVHAQYEKFIQQ